ncbi:MAG: malto-oligosyltrehalose trehalohydrolase [Methylobacteriaceae bacterium]|nr:malto-oligosyltrehalose trehalohydrolase [Methylobacteriaceae bacterium]
MRNSPESALFKARAETDMDGCGQEAGSGRSTVLGAETRPDGVAFRVWAPKRRDVRLVLDDREDVLLTPEADGYHATFVPGLKAGARYRYRLDRDERLYPDPASRFQPDGPHGASEIVDPAGFRWTDEAWPGLSRAGQVLYEMHIGTFTPEGTWAAAAEKLTHLRDLGVTTIEMMPVAEFPGRFGWGYDGVDLFAPTRLYGRPDDLRAFIDRAHGLGLGVILDVVYNHLGPSGNYLACFAPAYFSDRRATEWGEAINFDGPDSGPVREFFVRNAAFWVEEYHFDGLRLDATQSIFDDGPRHVLAEIVAAVRDAAAPRGAYVVGENEPQETRLLRAPEAGGYGLDALWNDDLHHSTTVVLTGRNEAYYEDHLGEPQEFVSAARHGYLFQGQLYAHQAKARGTAGLDLAPDRFVTFLENHDQVANSEAGRRLHRLGHPGLVRALTAYLLLGPGTPMLFQGQEWGSGAPFLYFADHEGELAALVRAGRADFLTQFPSIAADREIRDALASPESEGTFHRSKLDWEEARRNGASLALHRDLLALRRGDPVLSGRERRAIDGAVIGSQAFLLRYLGEADDDRLILVNLGRDLRRPSLAEPLAAPPASRGWRLAWSSESPRYDGRGTPDVVGPHGWHLPAASAMVLAADTAPPSPAE